MKFNALSTPLMELESFTRVLSILNEDTKENRKTALCAGVVDSQKCHLSFALMGHLRRSGVIIASSELRAKEIVDDMRFFHGNNVKYYPAKDVVFYNADARSADLVKQRFEVINALISNTEKITVVLSIEALFDRLASREEFVKFILRFEEGQELSLAGLSERLVMMGYERADMVEGAGQFSVRGGIVDIFTPIYESPVRIELWGDAIDSIRLVDRSTQRSIEKVVSVEIYPMRELVYDDERLGKALAAMEGELSKTEASYKSKGLGEEARTLRENMAQVIERFKQNKTTPGADRFVRYFYDKTHTLFDYVDEDAVIFFDEPVRIAAHADNVYNEYASSMQSRIEKGYALPLQAEAMLAYSDVLSLARRFTQVLYTTISQYVSDFRLDINEYFTVKSSGVMQRRIDMLEEELKHYIEQDYRILILAGGKTRAERLCAEFNERRFKAVVVDGLEDELERGKITLHSGGMNKGFEYPLIRFAVVSGKEIFDAERKKGRTSRRRKRDKGAQINNFADLKVGDYVVHDNHGVGIYRGIEKIGVDGFYKDYLKISYKDGGNLYVAINQLDMLQKYIGGDAAKPALNKLGGGEWGRAKSRVRGAIKILAEDLVKLYAQREAARGYTYSTDTVWQVEFEETFPYEETDDQLAAINDVKRDMESGKIMDRLICGDVGYGKTEIAIRAAFKAVQDGRQVAYLVPTTILAQQHYNTFTQRMKDFPVSVELLSRFRTTKQQGVALSGMKNGLVDIVIGTHRLLSKDIGFKNLGLVIVDEEQRFGVSHKEKLKRLTENVCVLTLTATPIPRTLHMSLTGIRDMSVLEEPPEERRPIQTYVMEYNPESVKDAINREVSRGGQVYYLHNRVSNIHEVASRVQKLAPEANVTFAHGQMSERELENVMMDFIEGNIDVLVCTTIIETGLDIPNVNTIIVQDADYMGLSQLYQIRGRVGRSNRSSYAYLMYRKNKVLTETSEKRLQTIREFTEFGAGFKIAMRDLEIRGAGNMLGAEQHGNMDTVGYDMYCKLLAECVAELRGEYKEPDFETLIDVNVDAFIPPFFIGDEFQKLDIYKKIAAITNETDYYDVQEEIEDRFGTLPASVQNLLDVAYLKACAHDIGVSSVKQKGRNIVLSFLPNATADPLKISAVVNRKRGKLTFTVSPPTLVYKLGSEEEGFLIELREIVKQFI